MQTEYQARVQYNAWIETGDCPLCWHPDHVKQHKECKRCGIVIGQFRSDHYVWDSAIVPTYRGDLLMCMDCAHDYQRMAHQYPDHYAFTLANPKEFSLIKFL